MTSYVTDQNSSTYAGVQSDRSCPITISENTELCNLDIFEIFGPNLAQNDF